MGTPGRRSQGLPSGGWNCQQLMADLLVRGHQIDGHEAEPMALHHQGLIHRGSGGRLKQQPSGPIGDGMITAWFLQRLHALNAI